MGHLEHAKTLATFPPTCPLALFPGSPCARAMETGRGLGARLPAHYEADFPPQDKPLPSPPPSKQILEDVFVCNNLGGPQSEVSTWVSF